ncbi:hypothetical protein VTK56DRAFT_8309 [Thermocarpiscus australiensis]
MVWRTMKKSDKDSNSRPSRFLGMLPRSLASKVPFLGRWSWRNLHYSTIGSSPPPSYREKGGSVQCSASRGLLWTRGNPATAAAGTAKCLRFHQASVTATLSSDRYQPPLLLPHPASCFTPRASRGYRRQSGAAGGRRCTPRPARTSPRGSAPSHRGSTSRRGVSSAHSSGKGTTAASRRSRHLCLRFLVSRESRGYTTRPMSRR